MNKETFDKLSKSVWVFTWPDPIPSVWRKAGIKEIIDIYLIQERFGGYSQTARIRAGLRKFRLFGLGSLAQVEKILSENGYPSLKSAPLLIREFANFIGKQPRTSEHLDEKVILTTFITLGRKSDSETVRKVLEITRPD